MNRITATAAALALAAGAASAAPEVTLTVHHFIGPNAPTQTVLVAPWAEKIEQESGGRIDIEIFPAMSMGGKPPELYRQVRDGVADIVWTLPGYTPGVFPRLEVFELPTVHRGSARATNLAIQDMMADLAPDLADIHPLLIHVHSGNALALRDGAVDDVADVAGLKIRTPSRTGAWLLEAWGAEPVGMPLPDLPQALSRGGVDGALVPMEITPPLKLQELVKDVYEGPEGLRFGASVFLFAMNKERYESLPEDLRRIIDDNSGAAIASMIGEGWDAVEVRGTEVLTDGGGTMHRLSADSMASFDARSQSVVDRWIEEMASQGVDGAALVEKARAAVAAHSR